MSEATRSARRVTTAHTNNHYTYLHLSVMVVYVSGRSCLSYLSLVWFPGQIRVPYSRPQRPVEGFGWEPDYSSRAKNKKPFPSLHRWTWMLHETAHY